MYFERKLLAKMKKHLKQDEITIVTGARQVGKTTLMKQLQDSLDKDGKSTMFLNLEILETLEVLNKNPENIWQFVEKNGEKQYVFLDEIQYLKNPSNFLKHLYDEYKGTLKLIVSGSSAFYIDQKFTDSLAGRKRLFVLRSLSFPEFLIFKGLDKLAGKIEKKSKLLMADGENVRHLYEEYILYGGYPRVVLAPKPEKEEILREIINSYLKKDIDEYGIKDSGSLLDFLRILANQTGSLLNLYEISATLRVPLQKIKTYYQLLQKTFYIQPVKPFHRNLRKELTKMPKCYFLDCGIRNYLIKDFRNLKLRNDRGPLLEQAVFVELIQQYNDDRSIQFWRTQNKNEVDFVVEAKKAYEVKYDRKNFSSGKYRLWKRTYPGIPLQCIAFIKSGELSGKKVLAPWEI